MRKIKFKDSITGMKSVGINYDADTKTWYMFVNGEWLMSGEPKQFTGLKDNNGIEIYEGDIIKYVVNKPNLPESKLPEYYHLKSITNYKEMEILTELLNNIMSSVEVIGNENEYDMKTLNYWRNRNELH